eukprot:TRINITY_DN6597_c0_g1_i3.p1 TRINITY_DN6597_c0_g1~~TRINITY_DN6597_c0_g1_i3.p1  ORF type:complete len:244 (-),score=61.63 TRINITY_DN6597_c0_g1_i3:212-943(-)
MCIRDSINAEYGVSIARQWRRACEQRTMSRGGLTVDYSGRAGEDEVVVKLLCVGDSGVGKTSLIVRAIDDTFSETFVSTVGIDFFVRKMVVGGCKARVELWDTAGQERFRSITSSYYRSADAILLCFRCNVRTSFDQLAVWLSSIRASAPSHALLLIVSTCCDLSPSVSTEEAQNLADEHGIHYFSTSAATGTNVQELITFVAQSVVSRKLATVQTNVGAPVQLHSHSTPGGNSTAHNNKCGC